MYYFIVNERAGGGRGANRWKLLRDHMDIHAIPYTYRVTQYKHHAETIAHEWEKSGIDFIIAVGGDGTLHEILNGRKTLNGFTLGIIPTGTGNDFALPLGIPKNPIEAFKLIEIGKTADLDLMDVGGRRAICFATSGLDIALVEGANKLRKKGTLSYLRMLLKELHKNKTYAFSVDSVPYKDTVDTFFLGVTTNGIIGSGMKLCPPASPFDGKLDLVVIEKRGRAALPRILISLYTGSILERKNVKHYKGEHFLIKPLTLNAVDLDGELYYDHPFEIKLLAKACKLILP